MNQGRILLAGSGAVGAIFAYHLERAGCSVTFLVRDPASPNAAMPRQLHQFKWLGRARTVTQNVPCMTRAKGEWDQVWLCLPSTALRSDWLAERLDEVTPGTPLVFWTPDVRDRKRLEVLYGGQAGGKTGGQHGGQDGRPNDRSNGVPIVQGVIGFLSFQSPLPGTDMPEKGIGYVLPPVAAALLEDASEGERVVAWLREGGLSARTHSDLEWTAARGAAVLICAVAALEINGWSIERLRESGDLTLAHEAAIEAIRAGALAAGRRPGVAARLPYDKMLALTLRLAPRVVPIPLEDYLRYHFSKVSEQTRMMLDTWLDMVREDGQVAPALKVLRAALDRTGAR